MSELGTRIRRLLGQGALNFPVPGAGRTADRHLALMNLGRVDLSLARLAEAHTDAVAILEESRRPRQTDAIYGVWASDGPRSQLTVTRSGDGWCISGIKQYCSGAGILDGALVTAHSPEGVLLFDVPLKLSGISNLESSWASPALADTATGSVRFDEVCLPHGAAVGGPDWYLERPGFWHGAIGPAACWAGGAAALIEAACGMKRRDPHALAQVGALTAIGWGLEAVLVRSGQEIDREPTDGERARKRALKVRHLIERWCTETMDRFGQATGPQLLAHDPQVVRQHAALAVYIRQCHGAKDLEALAAF